MDFILNGQAQGSVASQLMASNFDINALRPFIGDDGRTYQTVNHGGVLQAVPTNNATATLRKDEWKLLDEAVVKAAKERLRAVADLRGAGLQFTIPNGMSKTVLETETQSDITDAIQSMDGMRQSEGDRPEYELTNLPLPITHKDFYFSARQVAASRNGGSPLDTTMAELASRKVAESVEQLLLGTSPSYKYGGGEIFGYTNFPDRLTKSLTDPTSSGWTPALLVQEVLGMKTQSQDAFHFGPWMVYASTAWDAFMDDDYSADKGDNTLRERLVKIDGITDVVTSDFLLNFDLILVQMTSDVARMIIGMDVTTVQWETQGGMRLNFKVMAINVPQLRSDFNNNTGIVHGTV